MMKTFAKSLFYACILGMTVSCSGSSSSTSEATPEIIDSIQIHQIDTKVNILEVQDIGNFPAGKNVPYAVAIRNFDSVRGARITSIDSDDILRKCRPSLDSIEPGMIISVDFRLMVPEEKGPFDATLRIHYKDVRKPSIIKIHGNAE